MTDRKISGLPTGSALTGAELLEMVQSSSSRQVTTAAVAALAAQDVTVTYPPLPIPNLATWMQAHVTAMTFGNWIWGDVTVTSPITINCTTTVTQNIGFDFGGARIICGFSNTSADLLTITIPVGAAGVGVDGFQLRNGIFIGSPNYLAGSPTPGCRSGVVITSVGNGSGMFGMSIRDCAFMYCTTDGLLLGGDVFECDVNSCFAHGNGRSGACLYNFTNIAGSGLVSSVNFIGGDYRENKYGILATADVAFTEPGGFNVDQSNFIANLSSGIKAGPGFQSGNDLHFENNCGSNGGETSAAIWSVFGPVNLTGCQAPSSNSSPQLYLGDLGSANPVSQQFFMNACTAFNEDNNADRQYAILRGSGVLYLDQSHSPSRFDLGGGATWKIIGGMGSATLTAGTVTTSTYTMLASDTDITCNRAGTVTITLLPPATLNQCRSFWIRTIQAQAVVSASSNVVPRIGGSPGTAILAASTGSWAKLTTDGTNYQIMAGS